MRTLAVLIAFATSGCVLERHASTDGVDDNDCYACHRANYEQASNPLHVGVMPTTCRDCHSTTAWRPAGQHPDARFPIRSGPHAAADCGACHKPALGVPQGGANTDCLGCHPMATTAAQHPGVTGYGWDPGTPHSCLTCHPQGLAGDHPEDRFPIATGNHQMPCADCHIRSTGPDTGGLNTTCTGCHTGEHGRTQADADHQGVGDYAWSDTNPRFCLTCHPSGQASSHPEARFPIATGNHQMPCADCHIRSTGPDTGGLNTTCTGCHTGEHARTQADGEHQGVGDYAWSDTDPRFCLRCHPRGQE